MTQAKTQLTFEEYLNLDAEGWIDRGLPEGRCEYVEEGDLIELPSESDINTEIAHYLFLLLVNAGIRFNLIRLYTCEIAVSGEPRTRFPDLVIMREEHLRLRDKRLLITKEMPPPQIVVEVVSPGDRNHRRDYEEKRKQYEARGIPEFWLIDPEQQTVLVLKLKNQQYVEVGTFRGDSAIDSPTFQEFKLTAHQILTAGEDG